MTPSPATAAAPQYREQGALLVVQIALTASQALTRVPVPIPADADYLVTGIHGTKTGEFTINFRLPNGDSFANAQLHATNLLGTANQPTPLGPMTPYPRGSSGPMLDLTDVSGAPNTLEIVFTAIRRTKV